MIILIHDKKIASDIQHSIPIKTARTKIDIFFIKQTYRNVLKTQNALANEEEKDKSLIDS